MPRFKRGRLRRPLPLVMPLSPETRNVGTVFQGHFFSAEEVQTQARERMRQFMPRAARFHDYDIFRKLKPR